ncbi:hypothetical protein THAOC_09681 [Thalassiosira oceanica]|uniref:DUF6820 domain-containing protein n=1 Tax=Thalassiosira oceanica TaxID=159749 RepID=K0T710_THAOC|nr:hypothetical protein THAOC_09681 [Thalassiosira oceanica]|eukprot:EJK69101.1 hypothetical protein THAOC_09681 [Thalassiosira oceanica]
MGKVGVVGFDLVGKVLRTANRQRCRRGAAAEKPSTDIGPEGGVDGPRWTRGALQGLSSIPHPTSVAAGFYRNAVINGSGTSAGRARLTMSEFAVTPARLIDNGGRAMGAIIGPPGEAMKELDSPYRCCAGRADRARQGAVVALQMRRATYAQGRSG